MGDQYGCGAVSCGGVEKCGRVGEVNCGDIERDADVNKVMGGMVAW